MKKTITISASLPEHIVNQLDVIAADTGLSRSAVLTAILSLVLKWEKIKEVFKYGICGRQA
jgi:metal-responsive CopG/Arc/MetJ family transcriptional regulator